MILNQPQSQKPYEYQEYPKWVKDREGKAVIVNNRVEEDEVTGAKPAAYKPPKKVEVEVEAAPPEGEPPQELDGEKRKNKNRKGPKLSKKEREDLLGISR